MSRTDHEPKTTWSRFFQRLRETEPIPDRYDVEWHGPYFIPRPRVWRPTHFMLYGNHLHATMQLDWSVLTADWDIGANALSCDGRSSVTPWRDPEDIWAQAIGQLTRRLRSALDHPSAYNRRVERHIPLEARTGKVVRRWTWPRGTRAPLSEAGRRSLVDACRRGQSAPSWSDLDTRCYLGLSARLYDVAFPELRGLTPLEKRAAKADGRHGGMLEQPHETPAAFREWFTSRAWSGCHPWEIVYGYPHGILFSPMLADDGTWRFHLAVDSPAFYMHAVKMAVALGEAHVPFVFANSEGVAMALRGLDEVEVGAAYGQVSVMQLREERPEGLARVCWDPLPQLSPITPNGRLRVEWVLRRGSPVGWSDHGSESASGESGRGP